MATFSFWYDETETHKAWFEADSIEHARELIEQVRQCELDIEELPNFVNKSKDYGIDIALETIESEEN